MQRLVPWNLPAVSRRLGALLLAVALTGTGGRAETPSVEVFLESCDPAGESALEIPVSRLEDAVDARGAFLFDAVRPEEVLELISRCGSTRELSGSRFSVALREKEGKPVLLRAGFELRDVPSGDLEVEPQDIRELEEAIRSIGARPSFIRGDVNADAVVNLSDAALLLAFLHHGDAAPQCLDAADVDGDGHVRSQDARFLLDLLFLDGPPPPPPAPRLAGRSGDGCGRPASGEEGLGCASFPPCGGETGAGPTAPSDAAAPRPAEEAPRDTRDRVAPKQRQIDTATASGSAGSPRRTETAWTMREQAVGSSSARKIEWQEAVLDFDAGSVSTGREIRIGITPLGAEGVPALDQGMTNVTRGPRKGYRFTPHGSKFAKAILVTLPYDRSLIPVGHREDDIHTFYFDDVSGSWKPLERVKVDARLGVVVSRTDHFTDMINATLTVPDHPTPMSFNPTSMKDIKAANPGAGIDLIAAPGSNSAGDARLSYPVRIPPGRNGMQPDVTIAYNSSGGNGWLGMGWDLPIQAVNIDTRWGVPRYDPLVETETYMLNGEELTPVAHRGEPVARTGNAKVFHTRVEGQFRRIIRHGNHPSNYWWEVTSKEGLRSFFGGLPAGGPAADAVLQDPANGNIFRWALKEVRDTHGNSIVHDYEIVSDPGQEGGLPGVQIYLKEIHYTGFQDALGPYSVRFIRDRDIVPAPPRRPDPIIDARSGFKMVTADLLKRVEVLFAGQMVRSYELEYEEGAFRKTLLRSVAQHGDDGTFFHRHEFAYFDDVRDSGGAYGGFLPPTTWSTGDDGVSAGLLGAGQATALGGSAATSRGGHLYVGFNPGAPRKQGSAGGKIGFSSSDHEGRLALVDLNGDGLPDKVFEDGGTFFFRPNLSGPGGGTVFGPMVALPTLTAISEETSDTITGGAEAYPPLGSVMLDRSDTYTISTIYFSDVNGDGLNDLVRGGQVLFNHLDAGGVPTFTPDSGDTPVPIGDGAVDTTGLVPDFDPIVEKSVDLFPLIDTLRRWTAPFTGQVRISGSVRLLEDTSAERSAYETADGVRVAIQRNGSEIWSEEIAADDYGSHAPTGVDSINVTRGDRIYFRVQSVFDGAYDRVEWAPRISYLGVPSGLAEVNGLDPYVYDAAGDFVLAGRAVSIGMPFRGVVRLQGNLVKNGTTTDDIALLVLKNGAPVVTRSLAWSVSGSIPLSDDVPVERFDTLEFFVLVDSPIDMGRIEWKPEVVYTAAEGVPVTDANGNLMIRVHAPWDADLYPDDGLTSPQDSWTAPSSGTVTVSPELAIGSGQGAFDSHLVFTVKRRSGLALKLQIPIVDGQLPSLPMLDIAVEAGEELFFDYSTRDAPDVGDVGLAARLVVKRVRLFLGGLDTPPPIPTVIAPSAFHSAANPGAFNEEYRRWSFTAYNGNRDRALQPVDESALTIDEGYELEGARVYPMAPVPVSEEWRSPDELCTVTRTTMSSSRLGKDYFTVPRPSDFAGGRAVSRLSTADQTAVAGSVGPFSGSLTVDATSSGEIDYQDMNGDRFPDICGRSRVQFTTLTGGLEPANREVPGLDALRESANEARNFGVGHGIGGNPAKSKPDAKALVSPSGTQAKTTSEQGSEMPTLGFSGELGSGSSRLGYELLDLNGDGLPDRVFTDGDQLEIALNLGYSFAPVEPWGSAVINDGRSSSQALSAGVGFNDGVYGFGGGASLSRGDSGTIATLADLNGDNLLDRLRPDGNRLLVAFNTGAGFAPEVEWGGSPSGETGQSTTITLGGGLYFTIGIGPLCIGGCYVIVNPGGNLNHSISRPEVSLRDLNGDGYMDHLSSDGDGTAVVALNRTDRTNLLREVRRPLGATIGIDYERDGNTYDLPQSRWNLSRVEVFDGHAGDGEDRSLVTFRYEGGVHDRNEREFYGYRRVFEEVRDPGSGGSLYRVIRREYLNGNYYVKGLLEREVLEDAAGNRFTETVKSYFLLDVETAQAASPDSTTATIFPQPVRTEQLFYEGRPAPAKSTFVEQEFDALGNITRFFDAGDAGADDDALVTIEYSQDLAHYIVARPRRVVVTHDGIELRRREAEIEVATGNLLEVRQYLEDGRSANARMDYHPEGNLRRVTGPPNEAGQRFQVELEYDAVVRTHVASVRDSFGLASTSTFNLKFGTPETTSDINGNQSVYTFDRFGRTDSVTGPYELGGSVPTIDFEYHPDAPVPWALTRHIDSFRSIADPIETVLFVDGLGRVVQSKKDGTIHTGPSSAPRDVMLVSGRTLFDFLGRTVAEFHPTVEPLGARGVFNAGFDGVDPTTIAYDVLDRARRITLPDGTTTTTDFGFGADRTGQTQFEVVSTDANGIQKRVYRNVRELVTSIRETNKGGAEVIWTSYGHDPLKQLTAVVDDRSNETRLFHDNLGRNFRIDHPDTGRTETRHDLAGNVVAKITSNLREAGREVRYEYDFNRLRATRYPLFPSRDVTYVYGGPGAAHNGAGRVISVRDQSGVTERRYGKLGEIVREMRTIPSIANGETKSSLETYTTDSTYDTWGRLQRMVYPDREVLTYSYDSGGLVQAARGVKDGIAFPYLKRLEYDKFEQIAFQETQNGIETVYRYDPLDRRLANLTAGKAGGRIFQNLVYAYDDVGNVLEVKNDVPVPAANLFGGPVVQTYDYDDLYRLVEAKGSHTYAPGKVDRYGLSMSYDTIYNITKKSQLHELVQPSDSPVRQHKTSYDHDYGYGARPHAPEHVGDRTYTYDANGNQLGWTDDRSGNRREIVWDEDNRIQAISDNGHTKRYVYNDVGDRVIKRGPQGETIFVNPFFTVRNRTVATKHIYAGRSRLASKLSPGYKLEPKTNTSSTPDSNFLYFFHPDHLGSSSYVTDASGKVYEHIQYFPFGESWVEEKSNTQRTPYLFTAKELDEETDLYYIGARYFDPRTSVWQSPDPIFAKLLHEQDPAKLNVYTYTAQNPLRYVDPTGLDAEPAEVHVYLVEHKKSLGNGKDRAAVQAGIRTKLQDWLKQSNSKVKVDWIAADQLEKTVGNRDVVVYFSKKDDTVLAGPYKKAREAVRNPVPPSESDTFVPPPMAGGRTSMVTETQQRRSGPRVFVLPTLAEVYVDPGNASLTSVPDLSVAAYHEVGHDVTGMDNKELHAKGGLFDAHHSVGAAGASRSPTPENIQLLKDHLGKRDNPQYLLTPEMNWKLIR